MSATITRETASNLNWNHLNILEYRIAKKNKRTRPQRPLHPHQTPASCMRTSNFVSIRQTSKASPETVIGWIWSYSNNPDVLEIAGGIPLLKTLCMEDVAWHRYNSLRFLEMGTKRSSIFGSSDNNCVFTAHGMKTSSHSWFKLS